MNKEIVIFETCSNEPVTNRCGNKVIPLIVEIVNGDENEYNDGMTPSTNNIEGLGYLKNGLICDENENGLPLRSSEQH